MFARVKTDGFAGFALHQRRYKSVTGIDNCIMRSPITASFTMTNRHLYPPGLAKFCQGAAREPK